MFYISIHSCPAYADGFEELGDPKREMERRPCHDVGSSALVLM